MSNTAQNQSAATRDAEYLKFVRDRLKSHDFCAVQKLERIDDLAELIFRVRKAYRTMNR